MEQLFASPVGRLEIVLGKLLPYLVLGLIQLLLVLGVGHQRLRRAHPGQPAARHPGRACSSWSGCSGRGSSSRWWPRTSSWPPRPARSRRCSRRCSSPGCSSPSRTCPRRCSALSRLIPARYLVHALRGRSCSRGTASRALARPARHAPLRGGHHRARHRAASSGGSRERAGRAAPVPGLDPVRGGRAQGGPPDAARPARHVHAALRAVPADPRPRLRGRLRRRPGAHRGGRPGPERARAALHLRRRARRRDAAARRGGRERRGGRGRARPGRGRRGRSSSRRASAPTWRPAGRPRSR